MVIDKRWCNRRTVSAKSALSVGFITRPNTVFSSKYWHEFLDRIHEQCFVCNTLWPRYKSEYFTKFYILGTSVLSQWHLYVSVRSMRTLIRTTLRSKVSERKRLRNSIKERSKRTNKRWLFSPAALVVRLSRSVFWFPRINIGAFAQPFCTILVYLCK